MTLPPEPIGSIPRPLEPLRAIEAAGDADTSTTREKAFAKIAGRIRGTALAGQNLAQR